MRGKYWNNTPEDNDRMRRRMAEFLVKDHVPLAAMKAIAVQTEEKKIEVEAILSQHDQADLVVIVRPSWYF